MQIVAPGGVGKTQLVKRWRETLLGKDDHGGTVRAFDWSFYSQGTQQQVSADEFFDRALRWFGETELEKYKDPWAKGERLATLAKQQRTLLILDGLESLQHPPGPSRGEIYDPSLQSFLRGLSVDNPGLCIVTTREAVPDLEHMCPPQRVTIELNTLDEAGGAKLLRLYGARGSDENLRLASRDYEGHALALILLGTYLRDRFGGDIIMRNRVTYPLSVDDDQLPALSTVDLSKATGRFAKHARRVMASYVNWFEHEPDQGETSDEDPMISRAAVVILRLVGLFNRSADAGCLNVLRAEPPISGLTEPLFACKDRDELWNQAVIRLRQARLLADNPSTPDSLDAHPIVREHFAAQLDELFADAACQAHRRLFEHLQHTANELPTNLIDLVPLYHAVEHGCKAGRLDDAMQNVYWKRIARPFPEFFSMKKLGAFSSELVCLTCFFDKPWQSPDTKLSQEEHADLIGNVGYCLRSLGRSKEATLPMATSVAMYVDRGQFDYAAIAAGNLSELHLLLGDVSAAVRQGEYTLELADRSGDTKEMMVRRTTLADILMAAGIRSHGRLHLAHAAFRDAERLQKAREPERPRLYSLWGYRFSQLLLDDVQNTDSTNEERIAGARAVRKRAQNALEDGQANFIPLITGLDHLMLGRTFIVEAECREDTTYGAIPELEHAERHMNESVSLLRMAGTLDWLPHVLLHRAALWRVKARLTNDTSNTDFADRDLAEAETMAERGSMLVWQIEAALERTRLALCRATLRIPKNSSQIQLGRESLARTKRLVKLTEQTYLPHVSEWGEWRPPEYVGVLKEGQIVGYYCRNEEILRLERQLLHH